MDPVNDTFLFQNKMVCQCPTKINSNGVWFGQNPLQYAAPLLMLQVVTTSLSWRAMELVLKPIKQPMIIMQIMGGIILGPSLVERTRIPSVLFPIRSKTTLDTIASFGVILFHFLVGVKTDFTMITKSGRTAVAIGISVFLSPYILGPPLSLFIRYFIPMGENLGTLVPVLAATQSVMIFPVVCSLLSELRLLNSDFGHLAMSSSMILDVCNWFTMAIIHALDVGNAGFGRLTWLYSALSCVAMVGFIFLVFRPTLMWVSRNTPQGEPVKEGYIASILITLLVSTLISDTIGQRYLFGPLILGIAVPVGPPIGSTLVDRLDLITTCLFFPINFVIIGMQTNVRSIHMETIEIMSLVVLVSSLGKIAAAMVPSLCFKVPIREALLIGLVMNVNGIIEIITYGIWRDKKILNEDTYSALIILVLLVTGSISPLVKILYRKRSRKYLSCKRRTIEHSKHETEFRILVCVHNQDNVPTIINLLEASNATKDKPIFVFILQLVELVGRSTPFLVSHVQQNKSLSASTGLNSERILNAFSYYEQQNRDRVILQPFIAMSPYVSMHEYVCSMAADKKTSIIILPFHKQWAVDGRVGSVKAAVRNLNCNVLDKAPCSVGILIDRGVLNGSRSVLSCLSSYKVAVLFLGGADDREALAYSARMARQRSVRLTVVRFVAINDRSNTDREKKFDGEALNEFRLSNMGNERIMYREEVVKDGEGTVNAILGMRNSYELMIVGGQRKKNSPFLMGLTDWNECPELGTIGDMLASTDFDGKVSVLVVQQQARVVGLGFVGNDDTPINVNARSLARNKMKSFAIHDETDDEEKQRFMMGQTQTQSKMYRNSIF
uniref:Cation/H(+) antiporter 15-like n=1 Tax=Nelumbo nucifera TaxID=4432 RepID=A0A822Y283_NELNU|nr:TPA_asm: hypothetical protein HUJ06_027830 [Nelumbo nucifera]